MNPVSSNWCAKSKRGPSTEGSDSFGVSKAAGIQSVCFVSLLKMRFAVVLLSWVRSGSFMFLVGSDFC